MSPEFWRGRRVLITGHTGFKGAWLAEWLLALGTRPAGYALAPSTQPALFDQLGLAERMDHRIGDVRDLEALGIFMRDADPEIVFHMAAQPLVRYSYEAPLATYAVNVMGTAHVLEVCRVLPRLRAVVIVTTDKCYENREKGSGYREDEPLGGYDPYSSSKACAELVTASYRGSFFNGAGASNAARVASARAGNVIGGGDWAADRLVPDAVRAFEAGRQVTIRYPDSVRPWQHVLDVLHGYLLLAEALCGPDAGAFAEAWNFGPDDRDAKSVRWVMDRLCPLWPEHPGWHVDRKPRPHEAADLRLDSTKALTRLGWHPALALNDALQLAVDWYRVYGERGDLRETTRSQIAGYMQLVGNAQEDDGPSPPLAGERAV